MDEPPTCPECGSSRVARISYGLVQGDVFDTDEVVHAGCMVPFEAPDRQCRSCGHQFGRWVPGGATDPA